jgi:hypothetical protein
MEKSTDGKALFFWHPEDKIKIMLAHERMLFQFTPSPALTTFTLTGLSESIGPLRQACKW